MSSAWHKGNGPVPRSLAGDGEAAAGGHDLLDVPGHAFGPAPPPVDQHHDGGQARTVNTAHTESAFLRGWKRSPARQPGERGISDLSAYRSAGRITLSDRRRSVPGARVSDLCGRLLQVGCPVCDADPGHLHT